MKVRRCIVTELALASEASSTGMRASWEATELERLRVRRVASSTASGGAISQASEG